MKKKVSKTTGRKIRRRRIKKTIKNGENKEGKFK